MKELKGMIAAMPTPFHEDETIDTEGIKKIVEHLVSGGIHGILAGGSTDEYSLMTMEERKLLIKTVCEASAGRVYILAGCSCSRTKDTVEMARYAKSADIGVVIYHYPAATAVTSHVGFYSEESDYDLRKRFTENVALALTQGAPRYFVNREKFENLYKA